MILLRMVTGTFLGLSWDTWWWIWARGSVKRSATFWLRWIRWIIQYSMAVRFVVGGWCGWWWMYQLWGVCWYDEERGPLQPCGWQLAGQPRKINRRPQCVSMTLNAEIMFYQIKETLCDVFYFVLSRFLSMSTVPQSNVKCMIKRMTTF